MAIGLSLTEHARTTANLRQALIHRAVIDQAIGIIMAQNRCPPAEAFDILSSASQHRNVKLRVLAACLVESVATRH